MSTPTIIPPRTRSRTPDPFRASVIPPPPPIDPQLLQMAEARGKQTAMLEDQKDKLKELIDLQYELQLLITAHIQNTNQQFASINSKLRDIDDLLDTGRDEIARNKASNKREFWTKVISLLTTILAVVLTLLKVWSDVPSMSPKKEDKTAQEMHNSQ